ncbi:MAG TPA: archaemetzincin family Zn-dependent metalloprotease, partial [Methanobacterium sp.]|nr:archaemetzincin family Zn-dependent metalloprotease [Methanobacterium sp.]
VENKLLRMLEKPLEEIFGIECRVSKDILEIPERSYNPSRDQYRSTEILYFMMNSLKTDSNHVIGVTNVDLYAPRLNFVLGEAEYPGNFAIISLNRLKSPNKKLFLKRVLTEAVHELGHTFGLSHCRNHLCVMHFSNSVLETDIKGPGFCSDCLSKLLPGH